MALGILSGSPLFSQSNNFEQDLAFLKQHTDVVLLKDGESHVAVVPAYQGRVMTSSSSAAGQSFGWLNYPLIEEGIKPEAERKGSLQAHIYVFGGEERFWIGPEGGQFSIFFKPGAAFEFEDWKTPASLDTLPFTVTEKADSSITFTHDCRLLNYSGFRFDLGITRKVSILNKAAIEKELNLKLSDDLKLVGYQTDNRIKNKGDKAWSKETGLLSIWILGMYNPAPNTTVVIPFKQGPASELGPVVNDTYFGKVPPEYIQITEDTIYFKGDGTRRGKIGITPQRSKGIAGSYDADGKTLNFVTYNVPESHAGYVNSMWEIQKKPFEGDVINSYNDGSPGPGLDPLGPFYELETSSPAAALKPGEEIRHIQNTIHITGSEEALDLIARKSLGVSLAEIKNAF